MAGTRRVIEECFEEAKVKVKVGPDQYVMRRRDGTGTSRWRCWARASVREQTSGHETGRKRSGYGPTEELIPMMVLEVLHLLILLIWTVDQMRDFILYCSWWRRSHQARAQKCHYKRRLSNLRL